MKRNMINILERLKNPGTIISLVSLIIIILTQLGIDFDSQRVEIIVKALCSIGILLGILNDPKTTGIDNPFSDIDTSKKDEDSKNN